ncbi:L-histidine N(alpha)-methyltransferase [Nibribacter ruber]|uniref:L-histidine N(Alpha)-methyltransferase n=1 Tax=Nibribacter ruber TaxID=2698458 RepID=A0A6P1NW63_9BACT|nr:L-histidine N(alpha)-methyltransferase [Nibribacter ruber]QHL86208.1 L-histidine N(alpha)-methyltransferase [Nibribacter ruber]
MTQRTITSDTQLVNLLSEEVSADSGLGQDVFQGLGKTPKKLSSRFFYDAKGSQLFQQIMKLPEYYLTKLEFSILKEQRKEILYAFGTQEPFQLVDLGAGDAYKTKLLLQELVAQKTDFTFVPVDISPEQLKELLEDLSLRFPSLPVTALAAEYFTGLQWLQKHSARKLILFLGSNLGNFNPDDAQEFLCQLRKLLQPQDRFLLGIDLRKDPEKIRQAYDDAAGVTAAFNLNLLHRINKELQANFEVDQFQHFAEYDPVGGTMRSYLVSKQAQEVYVGALDQTFSFEPWETIHTENSYKYSLRQIKEMALTCGLAIDDIFTDHSHCFANVLLRPV